MSDMIEAFSIMILGIYIGLGVFLGWCIWGIDMKYYKNLAESYKKKLTSPEVKEAILEKRVKDIVNKLSNNRK